MYKRVKSSIALALALSLSLCLRLSRALFIPPITYTHSHIPVWLVCQIWMMVVKAYGKAAYTRSPAHSLYVWPPSGEYALVFKLTCVGVRVHGFSVCIGILISFAHYNEPWKGERNRRWKMLKSRDSYVIVMLMKRFSLLLLWISLYHFFFLVGFFIPTYPRCRILCWYVR